MANETSTDTNAAEDFSVGFAGLVDALGISEDDVKSHFSPQGETDTNTENQTSVDDSNGNTDAEGSSSTETDDSSSGDNRQELESQQPENDGPTGQKPGEGEAKDGDGGKGLPPSVQARIDKLTAEKYQAREEAERLQAEVTQLKTQVGQTPQVVSADTPLGDVDSHARLLQVREQALQAKEFCLMNPNGGAIETTKDGKTETKEFSPDDVREMLVKANRLLDRDIPARKEYLDASVGHFQVARASYPNLFDPNHPDAKLAGQFLRLSPFVKKFSDYPVIIGDYIAGARARLAREATAGKSSGDGKVIQMPTQNGKAQPPANKAKVIGSPKGQAGPRTRTVVSVGDIAKSGRSEVSEEEAANILDSFFGLE